RPYLSRKQVRPVQHVLTRNAVLHPQGVEDLGDELVAEGFTRALLDDETEVAEEGTAVLIPVPRLAAGKRRRRMSKDMTDLNPIGLKIAVVLRQRVVQAELLLLDQLEGQRRGERLRQGGNAVGGGFGGPLV